MKTPIINTQIIDNQKAIELENEISIATDRFKESNTEENKNLLTKAIENLNVFFDQYR
jgi:hypothetical protein